MGLGCPRAAARARAVVQQPPRLLGGPGAPRRVRGARRPWSSSTRIPVAWPSVPPSARRWSRPRPRTRCRSTAGIVGVNRPLDMAVVEALAGIFVEILFAPALHGRGPERAAAHQEEGAPLPDPLRYDAMAGATRGATKRARRPAGPDGRPAAGGRAPQDGDATRAHRGRAGALGPWRGG